MKVPANNQGSEGMINNEKNLVSEMRTNTAEPATYWWYSYLTLLKASKYLVSEVERCDGYLAKRKALFERKALKAKKAAEEAKSNTEDSKEMEAENNTDMVFSRNGKDKEWLEDENVLRGKVKSTLQIIGLGGKSFAQQLKSIDDFAGVGGDGKRKLHLSQPTFNKWIQNKGGIRKLDDDVVAVMTAWVDEMGIRQGNM